MFNLIVLTIVIGIGLGSTTAYGISRSRRKKRIHFCKAENLEKELDRFDIELAQKDRCTVCGEEINPEDMGSIIENNGEYFAICNEQTCLDNYYKKDNWKIWGGYVIFNLPLFDIFLSIIIGVISFIFTFLVGLYYFSIDKEAEDFDEECEESLKEAHGLPDFTSNTSENIVVTSDSNFSKARAVTKSFFGKALGKPHVFYPLEEESPTQIKKKLICRRTRDIPGVYILPENVKECLRNYYRYKFSLQKEFEEEICEEFKENFESYEKYAPKVRELDKEEKYEKIVFFKQPEAEKSLLNEVFLPLVEGMVKHCVRPIDSPREKDEKIKKCESILMEFFYGLYSKNIVGSFVFQHQDEDVIISEFRNDVKNSNRWGYWVLPCKNCSEEEFRIFRYVGFKIDDILDEYWNRENYHTLYPLAKSISDIEFVDTPFLTFKKKKEEFSKGAKHKRKKGQKKYRKKKDFQNNSIWWIFLH